MRQPEDVRTREIFDWIDWDEVQAVHDQDDDQEQDKTGIKWTGGQLLENRKMNENKSRELGEICGDIERHCDRAERSSVPANAEHLLRLLLDAAKHLPAIQATANLAHAQAIEAQRVARDVAAAAAKAPAKTTTKKAA